MAQLQLNKLVSFLGKLIAFLVILGIILAVIVLTLKPKIVAMLEGTQERELIVNGTVSVEGDLPFYDEFVRGYRQCKLSPSENCYCQIPYAGTPEGYIIELSNSGTTTTIRVNGGAEVDYSLWSTGDASLAQMEGVTQVTTRDTQVNNDILYFKNTRWSLPAVEGGRLNLAEFTKVDKQYIAGTEVYSTKDVDGQNKINIERGIALYKFDGDKVTFYPLAVTQELRRCNQVENIIPAEDEFNRLLSLVNDCVTTNQREKCKYIRALPNNYTLHIENKRFVLKHNGEKVKSSSELTQNLCLFNDLRNTRLEQASDLTTFTFDYQRTDLYSFDGHLCFLPFTPEIEQQAMLLTQQARLEDIRGNLPLIPAS